MQHFSVLFTVFVTILSKNVCGEVFTSQADLEGLIFLRREINHAIDLYIHEEEKRLEYLKEQRILSRGLSQKGISKDDGTTSGNPIEAFLLVKGLSMDLAEIVAITGDRENFKRFAGRIEELNRIQPFPGSEDMSGAAMGLIRLQDTYQLDTTAVANGALGDSCCASQLSVDDCFELGRQSYNAKNYDYAVEWMSEALVRFSMSEMNTSALNNYSYKNKTVFGKTVPPKISKSEIQDYLHWAQDIKRTLDVGKDFLSSLTGVELDAFVDTVAQVVSGQQQEDSLSQKELGDRYKQLCRGESASMISANKDLTCSYSTRGQAGYLIGPVKQEMISLDPPMWSFKEAIFSGEIEILKSLARPKFETAMIVNVVTGSNVRSDTRISKSAWLTDEDHPVISRVNRRIGHLTGLNMDTAELLQVANYGIGGMYLSHYDFALPGQAANFLAADGNRVATALLYMSNVEKGGATVFPKLNLTLWPEKGSVVFWYNLKRNGEGDMRTQHAACPVLVGSKWVSNKWLHERGQEFRYMCGLNKND